MKIANRNQEPRYTMVNHVLPAPHTIAPPGVEFTNAPTWTGSTAIVPTYRETSLPVPQTGTETLRRRRAQSIVGLAFDVRAISPREMDALGFELYVSGCISWDDYAELAFQPQLHPDYDATIGALTGEHAEPDQAQDFVQIWEERLVFDRRYNGDDAQRIQRTHRIVRVMRSLESASVFSN